MTAPKEPSYLTKTRYVNGLACQKWLWLAFNSPGRLPKADESAQFHMDEGRQVGELARTRYSGGVLLPTDAPRENDQRSRKLLDKRMPLFEAGFIHPNGSCYARADVLLPAGEDEWDLVEVKSGGSVQEEHLHDVAFQRHCYIGAGLRLRRCSLLHINTKYQRSGEIDSLSLFEEEDITDRVRALAPTIEPRIAGLLAIVKSSECPEFGRGEPFHKDEAGVHAEDALWKKHPDSDILTLYRGGKQAIGLLQAGVYRIRDIPKSVLRGKQLIQHAAHTGGKVHADRKAIAAFLATLRYPLHFLDFETFGTAIPLFDESKPYQQIPFQFSVHVVKAPGQRPAHHSYLSMEAEDPRSGLLESLRRVVGCEGSLVAYNQSFEKRILSDLASLLPEHADWVREANKRFVDLMAPFREFAYYNPSQGGSASLKVVLPAVTGQGYTGFEIANGSQASIAYLNATFGTPGGKQASTERMEATREALERYCGRDTEGMVWIVEKLAELSGVGA